MKNELKWEARIFCLVSILLILFCCLVLRASLGMSQEDFIITVVPEMSGSLISSLTILTVEFTLWYIFRLKGKKIALFPRDKR